MDTRATEIGQLILEEAAEAVQPEGGDSTSDSQEGGIDGGHLSRSRMRNEEANEDDVADMSGNSEEDMDED